MCPVPLPIVAVPGPRRTLRQRCAAPSRSVGHAPFSIIRFLSCDPLPEADGWGENLVRHRITLGISQKEAALDLGVDPSTLAKWERGESEPKGILLGRV